MIDDLTFRAQAAAEYNRAFAHVSSHFLPFVLRAARRAPGHRVLDVASGTGISAEAALDAVGPSGSVLATDISPEMVEKARKRLRRSPNAAVAVEVAQCEEPCDSIGQAGFVPRYDDVDPEIIGTLRRDPDGDRCPSAWAQHTMEAGEAPRWFGEEHQTKTAYNGIEARLGKAERLSRGTPSGKRCDKRSTIPAGPSRLT